MKKLFIIVLTLIMICSLSACNDSTSNDIKSNNKTDVETTTQKENSVDVKDIGAKNESYVQEKHDELNNDVTDKWVPAAGRVGANLSIFENIDSDNAKNIINYANVASEAGYTPYILLGTKNENNIMSYAYLATTNFNIPELAKDVIVIVDVNEDESTNVYEFEGTRDEIVGTAN